MLRAIMLLCFVGLGVGGVVLSASDLLGPGQAPLRPAQRPPQTMPSPSPGGAAPYSAATFKQNTAYPAEVTVDLEDGTAAPDAESAAVGVRLSGRSANTVFAYVRCRAGAGARPKADRTQSVIFRPGDPLFATISCPVVSAGEGDTVEFIQANVPDGAKRGVVRAVSRITASAQATPLETSGFRLPYAFAPLGEVAYAADATSFGFADRGIGDIWATSLRHGRTQPANNEVGYYGTTAMQAVEAMADGIVMRTRRLAQAFDAGDGRPPYPFMASVLSGHDSSALQFTYGSIEWVARMPDRKGSWPALWLGAVDTWPPEIDVYEGHSYNSEWRTESGLSSALHGGRDGKRSFVRSGYRMQMGDFGLPSTLTTAFHRFQVTVEPQWITTFVDGVEVSRYANPFPGTRWYPLMTVAVKTERGALYNEGSGDMVLRSVRIWRSQ
ncbi:glycoside hydrolase family 16 protein [Sphingomonas qomolangmaensis]|uniref:Family 16 glycosylhydrolase n=1 Tax=Sphingomonas qomolangmaensis TaxID=2918765 RepID=A0ABY5L603_9SPHN|nr:family 16 glycosylhydrolase [Sphingomonas qomolangmaensis]UUL82389.1 family 16 glycosylhydrolase [Sphingomonas qomolangmaensis]